MASGAAAVTCYDGVMNLRHLSEIILLALCLIAPGVAPLSGQSFALEPSVSPSFTPADALHAQPDPAFIVDPIAASILQSVLLKDFDDYARGADALLNYEKIRPRYPKITAAEYWRVYHSNEIAADARFLDKLILIEGRVVTIQKDAFGYARVELASEANPFLNVQARLSPDAVPEAAHFSPGQIIRLQCIAATMIIGMPSLRACQTQDAVTTGAKAQVALQLTRWFGDKGVPTFAAGEQDRGALFTLYFMATKGGFTSKCLRDDLPGKECWTNIATFTKKGSAYRDEARAVYRSATASLHLPPLPDAAETPPKRN